MRGTSPNVTVVFEAAALPFPWFFTVTLNCLPPCSILQKEAAEFPDGLKGTRSGPFSFGILPGAGRSPRIVTL